MGESDAYGYPGCLPQGKGDNHGAFFLDLLLKINKVEPTAFSSKKVLAELIKDTEDLYTVHFGENDIFNSRTATDMGTGT